jgi:ankyrin repeat protein
MMATSSSSTSSPSHPTSSQQPWFVTPEKKICACQRLGELFGLAVPASEQACFEAAWEMCRARNWTLLKQCQEELNQIVNEQGRSLLQQAIRVGEIALATEMIANGIAIHGRDSMGNTAMHYAVQTESLNLVLKLYEHTSQDTRNEQGQTPLHYAAARGQLDVIRKLIAQGANLSATTQVSILDLNANTSLSIGDLTLPNLTPLAFAAIRGDRDCVDLFLSENRKNPALILNLKFGTMGNFVHLLITFHHMHLLKFVVKEYYEKISPLLDEPNLAGVTPFMLAAYLGEEEDVAIITLMSS